MPSGVQSRGRIHLEADAPKGWVRLTWASMNRARPGLVEVAGAALLAAGATLEILASDVSSPAGASVVAVVTTTAPLAWRSAFPVLTVAVTTAGLVLSVVLGFPAGDLIVPYLAPLVALYSVGVHSSGREILAAAAIALTAFTIVAVASPSEDAAELGFIAVGVIAALAVGLAVRQMGFETDTLAARAADLERSRDEATRAAIAAERARIARELHDVIGHSISVMGVQAGAVRRVLSPHQEQERQALLGVERVGRDAVTEMRRLLGFLRPAETMGQDHEPTPTLERLDDLVREMNLAGLDVELQVEGDLSQLSAGRALTVFRIIQEALTNALRHAPGSRVAAVLRQTPAELVIEVTDDGGDETTVTSNGGGYGLVGMRERVALYGGTLEAGPRLGRGYAVLVHLPTDDR
jgi:signal transduction histidine kinase